MLSGGFSCIICNGLSCIKDVLGVVSWYSSLCVRAEFAMLVEVVVAARTEAVPVEAGLLVAGMESD